MKKSLKTMVISVLLCVGAQSQAFSMDSPQISDEEKRRQKFEALEGIELFSRAQVAEKTENDKPLTLSAAKLSEEELKAIRLGSFNTPLFQQCQRQECKVDLPWSGIHLPGVTLIAVHLAATLTSLNLGNNQIGNDGAKVIFSSNFSVLRFLYLTSNGIKNEGIMDANGSFPVLKFLDLSKNKIGENGAKAIADKFPSLTFLNLNLNGIRNDGVTAIAHKLTALESLHVQLNGIGPEGATEIAKLANLMRLDLGNNIIGRGDSHATKVAGIKAIFSGSLSRLVSLDLHDNEIGDEGAEVIITGKDKLPFLESLNLQHNNIKNKAKEGLREKLSIRELFL